MGEIVERLRRFGAVVQGRNPKDYAVPVPAVLIIETADEIERLRDALRFYADEENWDAKVVLFNSQGQTVAQSEVPKVAIDNGDIARAALGEKQ